MPAAQRESFATPGLNLSWLLTSVAVGLSVDLPSTGEDVVCVAQYNKVEIVCRRLPYLCRTHDIVILNRSGGLMRMCFFDLCM